MERASLFAINQRDDWLFRGVATLAHFTGPRRGATDESLVSLHRQPATAHQRAKVRLACGLADTVHEEPGRFEADAEHPMELMRAHPLLAGRQQVHGFKPDMQRNFRPLHDRADRDRELLAAGIALVEARAVFRAAELGYAIVAG